MAISERVDQGLAANMGLFSCGVRVFTKLEKKFGSARLVMANCCA
jgi:hypothetical protein